MFKVINKNTNNVQTVYKIKTNTNGYPTFLVHENNQWLWKSAKHFKPVDEDSNYIV